MLKNIRCGLMISGLLLPLVTYAIADVTFTTTPTFIGTISETIQTGDYTIRNNTPVPLTLNYFRMHNGDTLPDAAAAAVPAPTNSCFMSLDERPTLAAGSSCNIRVELRPLSSGVNLERTLQVGIDTRQVQIDAATIDSAISDALPAPTAPAPGFPGAPAVTTNAAIFSAESVMSSGLTVVNGDVDVHPGSAVTGFAENASGVGIITNGAIFLAGTAESTTAEAEALALYDAAVAAATAAACPASGEYNKDTLPTGRVLTGLDLGDISTETQPLPPGIYCASTSIALTGTLYLDGSATDDYVFVIGSTLTTDVGSNVRRVGTVPPTPNDRILWAVGTSATIGTSSHFRGIVNAASAVSLNTGARLDGRAWGRSAGVTLLSNAVDSTCNNIATCDQPL